MLGFLWWWACSSNDPDASGARWDTGTDPRPSTTDPTPDTLSVIDTGSATDTGASGDPGLCRGDGDGEVVVGYGGLSTVVAYRDGDDLPLVVGADGAWGFVLDVTTTGLDTEQEVNAVLRAGIRGGQVGGRSGGQTGDTQEEWLAKLLLQCPRPGPGWVRVFAPLPDRLQGDAPTGGLDGVEVELALSLVDADRDEDTASVDLRFTR